MKEYYARRVFVDTDLDAIRTLQTNVPSLEFHYPRHQAWLEMALAEVKAGRRLAFGVFVHGFDEVHQPMVRLIGCAILKPRIYADVIEMKNFFIDPDFRRKGAAKELYAAVEEHCARSGYKFIEVEAPCASTDIVGFLHSANFRVTELLSSPYRRDDVLYRLVKQIPLRYRGDSYDIYAITSWLLTEQFHFDNLGGSEGQPIIHFEIPRPRLSHDEGQYDNLAIEGTAVILDDELSEAEAAAISPRALSHLTIVVAGELWATRPLSSALQAGKRVLVSEIYRQLGSAFASPVPSFPRSAVNGAVVVLTADLFARIVDLPEKFAFFKSGPMGKYVKPGDTILFAVESSPMHPSGGIRGYATVVRVCEGEPGIVWSAIGGAPAIFSRDEFARFAMHKRSVTGFILENFTPIEVISFPVFFDRVVGRMLDAKELAHSYLSLQMVRSFRALARPTARSTPEATAPREWDIFVAHAGRDIDIAEMFYQTLHPHVRVFLDSKNLQPGDDWDLVLRDAQKRSYITLILISSNTDMAFYQREEIAAAIDMARADKTKHRVVPLLVKTDDFAQVDLPYGLRVKHSLSLTSDAELAPVAQQLIDLVRSRKSPVRC